MPRKLTTRSSLDSLKREAKRWLRALRANDPSARARLERALPDDTPAAPGLRDVQLALAREYGFAGWTALRSAVADLRAAPGGPSADTALPELLAAAERGDAERVAALLAGHPEIIDERGTLTGHTGLRTALHFGVRHPAVVRCLLERGADPNIRDEGDDAMPLHFAAEREDLGVIRLLIEHGADPIGAGTYHELDVLGWATCFGTGRRDVVDYLLAHGARYTIVSAVATGETELVRALVAQSPALLAMRMDETNHRRTPLHLAVVKKQPAVVATLLDLGGDPAARDAAGLTPLDQAALAGETEMARLLLDRGAPLDLPAAVALQRTDDIERLLREDPGCLSPGGRWATLIVRASEQAPGHVIETLIRAGASVKARDDTRTSVDRAAGYTPLHAAAFHGNADAAAVLLRHGADVNARESRYCGTPAGWANYAGHQSVRDLILEGDIDPFQAIDYDLPDRIPGIVQRSPWLLNKPFGEYATCEPRANQWYPEPWQTPLAWAVARNKPRAVRALLEQGAAAASAPDGRTLLQIATDAGHGEVAALLREYERFDETRTGRVRLFVKNACPDHDIRGGPAHVIARHTAERLLRRYPDMARDSFFTAIICGDLDEVRRVLAARPEAARERGSPKGWEPLLYLCFTRLPLAAASDNAVAIASSMLDHGADPNAYFMAGDSRYTPLVGAIGEGEEDRPPHPQRDALVRLLLDRGAEPYDSQVVYNIHFHGDILWFLKLMHEHALRLGRQADWDDPEWSMLNMGGYGSGARWHLEIALKKNDYELAEWCLSHGANPNSAPARDPRFPKRSLYEEAMRRGLTEIADLLLRYGATPSAVVLEGEEAFVAACLRLDREAVRALLDEHPEYLRSPAAIFEAAKRDRADVVALLLDLGMSIEIEDRQRQRPLHVAAYADALSVATLLIERGAAIDPVETRWKNTPLDFAVYAQKPRMIDLLSRHSKDVWNLAFTGNVARLRDVLREEPALGRVRNDNGSTPLTWLPDDESRAVEIVELFLAHGADPTARNKQGLTAADVARRRGMEEVAERLRSR